MRLLGSSVVKTQVIPAGGLKPFVSKAFFYMCNWAAIEQKLRSCRVPEEMGP